MPDEPKKHQGNEKRNDNKQRDDRDSRRVGDEQKSPTREDPSTSDEDEIPAV